jgi:hypothetical protein
MVTFGREMHVEEAVQVVEFMVAGRIMASQSTREPIPPIATMQELGAKSLGGARFCLCGFFFPILGRRIGFERMEETSRDCGYFIDGGKKRSFVGLRWFIKASDLSHELQRCSANLFVIHWWIEVEERLDISAHAARPPSKRQGGRENYSATPIEFRR